MSLFETLGAEAFARQVLGVEVVSFDALKERMAALGYKLNRRLDCRSMCQIMTGPYAGESYPCCTGYPVQMDDEVSFANVNARRDDKFKAMQALRMGTFAIVRGYIYEA